jgi:hypothetical protein
MQCNSAMPDFIIAGEKVIIRKSPNHIQNTLLIGDSTFLPGTKVLIHPGHKSECHEESRGERPFSELKQKDHVLFDYCVRGYDETSYEQRYAGRCTVDRDENRYGTGDGFILISYV